MVEGAEGKIKADGTTSGHRAQISAVCTLVRRRRTAPSRRLWSAAIGRNASIHAGLCGTTAQFRVFRPVGRCCADEQG